MKEQVFCQELQPMETLRSSSVFLKDCTLSKDPHWSSKKARGERSSRDSVLWTDKKPRSPPPYTAQQRKESL